MIPDRDDFWLAAPSSTTSKRSSPSSSNTTSAAANVRAQSVTAASGVNNDQLLRSHSMTSNNNDNKNKTNENTESQPMTAWKRYCYFIESMESRGQKFDQKLMLEAMFRGSNLVYNATVDCQTS